LPPACTSTRTSAPRSASAPRRGRRVSCSSRCGCPSRLGGGVERLFVPRVIVSGLLSVLGAATAAAQDTGVVSGTIVDQSGQVLPGATVTLVNEATNETRALVSDERGDFAFPAVQPGPYALVLH